MTQSSNNPLVEWLRSWVATSMNSEVGDVALEHSWNWPTWSVALIVFGCTGFVAWIYSLERGAGRRAWHVAPAVLRMGAVWVIVFMLYGYVARPFRTDLPDVVVAIDISGSMDHVDVYPEPNVTESLQRRVRQIDLGAATRLNIAKLLLLDQEGEWLRELASRYHVRYFGIGEGIRSLESDSQTPPERIASLSGQDKESRLGQALRDILESQRGRPTAAIILISDGLTTSGPLLVEAATMARSRRVQLFTVGVGSPQPPRNLRIGELVAESKVFVGDSVEFNFHVSGEGYGGREIAVGIRKVGEAKSLEAKTLRMPSDGSLSVSLSHRPEAAGSIQYEIFVNPIEGETDVADNRIEHEVSVANPTLKVLLVQEYPNFEFRYLKTLLERQTKLGAANNERAFDVTAVLQEADPNWTDATARNVFPINREELEQYHVIVFGDVNPSFLGGSTAGGSAALANISKFVQEHGGGIAFIAGPRHTPLAYRDTPLAELFPFQTATATIPATGLPITTAFTVRPTPLGFAHPLFQLHDDTEKSRAIWPQLPGLFWRFQVNDLKRGARVLAEHPEQTNAQGQALPLVMLQYTGAGKVVFHSVDETWRWRYRTGDVFFARYWTQLLRYLARSSVFESPSAPRLTSDRSKYRQNEPARIRVEFPDDRLAPTADNGVAVVAERAGGKSHRVTLARDSTSRGLFEASLVDLAAGKYHVYLASPTLSSQAPTCDFEIAPPAGERDARPMDALDMKDASQATGGKFYDVNTFSQLLEDLPAGRQVRTEPLPPLSIWNSWPVALVFVTLLVCEWLLRKWMGLV